MNKMKTLVAFATLMLCGGAWAAEQLTWEASPLAVPNDTVVFRGITLEQLKTKTVSAIMGKGANTGDNIGSRKPAYGVVTSATTGDYKIQFQIVDGNYLKWCTVKFVEATDNDETVIKATQLYNGETGYSNNNWVDAVAGFGIWQASGSPTGCNSSSAYPITRLTIDEHEATISANSTWANLWDGQTLSDDAAVTVTVSASCTLTVAASDNLGRITFSIPSGKTLTIARSNSALLYSSIVNVIGGGTLKVPARTTDFFPSTCVFVDANSTIEITDSSNNTNSQNGYLKGTGTIKFSGGSWHLLNNSSLPAKTLTVALEDNNGVIIPEVGANNYLELGSLSGTKGFRTDYGTSTQNTPSRNLRVIQSKNTAWSGNFKQAATWDRLKALEVCGAAGATEKTLTLAGDHTGADNTLAIDASGSVKLTGRWKGDVTINGEFGGSGSVTGATTITVANGAKIRADWSGDNGPVTVNVAPTMGANVDVVCEAIPTTKKVKLFAGSLTASDATTNARILTDNAVYYGTVSVESDGVYATLFNSDMLYCYHFDSDTENVGVAGDLYVTKGDSISYTDTGATGEGKGLVADGSSFVKMCNAKGLISNAQGWTVSLWVNMSTSSYWCNHAILWLGSNAYRIQEAGANKRVDIYPADGVTDAESMGDGDGISIGDTDVWHHMAFVSNGDEIKIYKDGSYVKSYTPKAGCHLYGTGFAGLTGVAFGEADYDGNGTTKVDEGAVFAKALTDSEIKLLASLKATDVIGKVAQIGHNLYSSVQDAISAAGEGQEIKILADSSETITLTKNVTFTVAEGETRTLSGVISGSYSVTKKGAGTLMLSGANTYTGGTEIVAGTIKLNNASACGTGDINVCDGGTLDVNNKYAANKIYLAGDGVNSTGALFNSSGSDMGSGFAWKISLTANASWGGSKYIHFGTDSRVSLNGFTFTKKGANSFPVRDTTISGPGKIIIAEGTYNNNAGNSTFDNIDLEVAKGATFTLNGASLTVNGFKNSSANTISNNAQLRVKGLVDMTGTTQRPNNMKVFVTTTYRFPEDATSITLCNTELTLDGSINGNTVRNTICYVGDEAKAVNLTYDTTAKTVSYTEASNVVSVGGVEYAVLQQAIEAVAEAGGGTITLIGDLDGHGETIPSGVVIDLDGHNLTGLLKLQSSAYILEGAGENKKVKIDGIATDIDLTFNGKMNIDYSNFGGSVNCNGSASYNNVANDTTTGIYLKHRPWVDNAGTFFTTTEQITFVTAGVMPNQDSSIFVHMGDANANCYGLFLATGTAADEVVVGYNHGTSTNLITTIKVPNARTRRHSYVITKDDDMASNPTKTTFAIYLDGVKWTTFEKSPRFEITGGFQVGSCYHHIVDGHNMAPDNNNAYVNFMRAYQRIITPEEIARYTEVYDYDSPNGTFKRTITENGSWVADGAWTSGEDAVDMPATNGNVELTADADSETAVSINLTEDVEYEKLTLKGTAMSFARVNASAKSVKAVCTVIGAPVTLNHRAVVLTAGPTIIADGGSLKFDFSSLTAAEVASNDSGVLTMAVTGEMEKQKEGVVTLKSPTDPDIKSAELVYNRNHYEVVVRNYAAKIVDGENVTRYDTLDAALAAARTNPTKVTILDGTTELPEGAPYYGYCVGEGGVIQYAVACVGTSRGYASLEAALAVAQANDKVMLLQESAETVTIPANVTVDVDGQSFAGSVNGAGTIVFDRETVEADPAFTVGNTWTGTVWLKNVGATGNSALLAKNKLNLLGRAGSTVKFTGCNGYIFTDNGNLNFNVEIDDTGWKNPSGSSGSQRNFGSLKGTGTFDGRSLPTSNYGQCRELEVFSDADSFAGNLLLGKQDAVGDDRAGKRVIIGTYNGMQDVAGNLGIGSNKSLTIAADKTLNAKNVFVKGTLTVASTATIDVAAIKLTDKIAKVISGQELAMVSGDLSGYQLKTTKDSAENPTQWTYTLEVEDITGEVTTSVANQLSVELLHIGATGIQTYSGAGSVMIADFAMREGAKLVFDPVRSPIRITAVPSIASGAIIELKSTWANHADEYSTITSGKIRLLTYPNTASVSTTGITIVGLKEGVAYALEEESVADAELKQLVLYIGDYKTAAKPIKLTQFGDSITEGIWRGTASENYVGTPNYRIPLMQRLEAHGYSPTTTGFRGDILKNSTVYGSSDANGVPADPKYRLHNGISAQRVFTGHTNTDDRAGFAEGFEAYLEASGDGQDIVTLKIGTNDILGGETGANVFEGWLDIVTRLVAKRPSTRIVVTPIIMSSSSGSNVNREQATAYNNAIADAVANNATLKGHVFAIDARTAVGNASSSFLGDGIHPNWVGHNNMADAWFVGVTNAFAKTTGKTYEPYVTTGAAANVPASYRKGFVKLATMDLNQIKKDIAAWGENPYTAFNSAMSDKSLTKVAYYVERSTSTSANNQFVWVDMDSWASSKSVTPAVGNTLANMGVPKDAQSNLLVNNLHIYSNVAEIRKVEPTTSGVQGTLLFTNKGCGPNKGIAEGPDSKFGMDWNDVLNNSVNYGAMVVSRVYEGATATTHRYALGQTLFSYNGFNNNIKNILGIGDFAVHCKQAAGNSGLGTLTLNWISPSDSHTYMSTDYLDHGVIEIWGVPEGYVVPDSDEGVEVAADSAAEAIEAAQVLPDTEAETAAGDAETRNGYLTFTATRVGESNNWKVQAVVDNTKLPENKKIDDTAVAFANAGGIVKLAGATEKQTISIPKTSTTAGLYYSVSFGTTPDDHTQESERVLATSGDGTVDIPVPALGNEKVYYIKVKASATK